MICIIRKEDICVHIWLGCTLFVALFNK